jgi:hypothetical protein
VLSIRERFGHQVTLTARSWWYMSANLIAIFAIFLILAAPEFYRGYLIEERGPALQRCFGFSVTYLPVHGAEGASVSLFAIAAVESGGPFDRSGIKPGDMPVGYHHGIVTGFYSELESALEGHETALSVLAIADWQKGVDGWREVHVKGPGGACE